jgi:hypothetical protein
LVELLPLRDELPLREADEELLRELDEELLRDFADPLVLRADPLRLPELFRASAMVRSSPSVAWLSRTLFDTEGGQDRRVIG